MKKYTQLQIFAVSFLLTTQVYAANMCSLLFRDEVRTTQNVASLSADRQVVENFKTVNLTPEELSRVLPLIENLGITQATDINSLAQEIRNRIDTKDIAEIDTDADIDATSPVDTTPARPSFLGRMMGALRGIGHRVAPRFINAPILNLSEVIQTSNQYAEVTRKIYKVLEKRLDKFFSDNGLNIDSSRYTLTKTEIAVAVKEQNPNLSEVEQKALVDKKLAQYEDISLSLAKAKFAFAENIAAIEKFNLSEYTEVDSSSITRDGYTLISHAEYPDYAMALAKGESPPRAAGSGGILSAKDYRDVVSSNLWLYAAATHDLKHMHFAHAHPMASVSFFRAARSKNHLRFILIAGMQEGVDTVQYSWETALAKRYARKGYTLEHAMIEIASMTQSELSALAAEVGVTKTTYDNWKPVVVKQANRPSNASDPTRYENDLVRFIARSLKDLRNPNMNIFMRPDLVPEGITMPVGTSVKPGERVHY